MSNTQKKESERDLRKLDDVQSPSGIELQPLQPLQSSDLPKPSQPEQAPAPQKRTRSLKPKLELPDSPPQPLRRSLRLALAASMLPPAPPPLPQKPLPKRAPRKRRTTQSPSRETPELPQPPVGLEPQEPPIAKIS